MWSSKASSSKSHHQAANYIELLTKLYRPISFYLVLSYLLNAVYSMTFRKRHWISFCNLFLNIRIEISFPYFDGSLSRLLYMLGTYFDVLNRFYRVSFKGQNILQKRNKMSKYFTRQMGWWKIIQTIDEIDDFTSSKSGGFSGNNNVKQLLYVCENHKRIPYFFLSINKNERWTKNIQFQRTSYWTTNVITP